MMNNLRKKTSNECSPWEDEADLVKLSSPLCVRLWEFCLAWLSILQDVCVLTMILQQHTCSAPHPTPVRPTHKEYRQQGLKATPPKEACTRSQEQGQGH